jgi:hypothetical protein
MQIKPGKVQEAFARKFTHERVPRVLIMKDHTLKAEPWIARAIAPVNPLSGHQHLLENERTNSVDFKTCR